MNAAEANEVIANSTIILMRGDFNRTLHPRMFDELCEQLGHDPRGVEELTLFIRKSRTE
jgi:hypothetical protein